MKGFKVLFISGILALCLAGLPLWTIGRLAAAPPAIAQPSSTQARVRNGDFEQGETAWAKVGSHGGVVAAGNPGNGMRIWPSVLDTNNLAYIAQQIHLPSTTNGATFRYDYRFTTEGGSLVFATFGAAIYTDLNQNPLVTLHEITDSSQLSSEWQTTPKTLSTAEVAALQDAHSAGLPLLLVVLLQAADLSVTVDNISLTVDGAMSYPVVAGEIVFLGQNASNYNTTVNRIKIDGSGRQTLWSHPDDTSPNIYDVAWKPDASEIAFSSDHEFAYSAYHADIYGMDAAGGHLRRITNPPAKTSWPNGHATGTVTGRIHNSGISFPAPFLIYIQGAKEPVSVSMPAFDEEVSFTVPDVEDLGTGINQFAVFSWSGGQCANGREYKPAVGDVQAGTTVDVGTLSFNGLCNHYNANHISWKKDGSQVGFLVGGVPQRVKSSGETGGTELFAGADFSNLDLAWSPLDDRILYTRRRDPGTGNTIFLTSAGGATGTQLALDNQNDHENPVWLPDGTGFLFTYNGGQAIGRYTFQSGQSQVLVTFYGERVENLSIAPDGQYLAFERQNVDNSRRDLWVLAVDKPNQQWQVTDDGRSGNPDWSRQAPGSPSQPKSIFLPTLMR
ncbi:MAG: hypothetical protein KF753_12100 [Caldilineaceae bacterium]|nr:hypothetical protein [Caldilineaceae bacterium]